MSVINVTKKPKLTKSNVPHQNKTGANSLTIKEWNEVINKLKVQADMLTEYLNNVHRILFYDYDVNTSGEIEFETDGEGMLTDSTIRLRDDWNPEETILPAEDINKRGWMYRISGLSEPVVMHSIAWSNGDYALYGRDGKLYNFTKSLIEFAYTPLVKTNTHSINLDVVNDSTGIEIQAEVNISPDPDNDISVLPNGVFSGAFKRITNLLELSYEEPTEDNDTGVLKIVFLDYTPTHYYNGWLYLVPLAEIIIEN